MVTTEPGFAFCPTAGETFVTVFTLDAPIL